MNEHQPKSAKAKADQSRPKKQGPYFSKSFAGWLEAMFGFIGGIFLAIGAPLILDAQYRWAGVFLFIAGITSGIGVVFIHWRHRHKGMRNVAIGRLITLTSAIVGFSVLGGSTWWFNATKDSDAFNVLAPSRIFSPPGRNTPFFAAHSLGPDNMLYPIAQMVFLRITNKQARSSKIVGLSLEMPGDSWWPSWKPLCKVDLMRTQLIWIDNDRNFFLFGPEYTLDSQLENPIGVFENVAGWTAWECPNNFACGLKPLRIAIIDAAGTTTWQNLSPPPIAPNLEGGALHVLGKYPPRQWRILSSCR